MRLRPSLVVVLSALVFGANVAGAAASRDSLVVSTAWLAQHLTDADLVLLHVGDKAEYDAGHLPGARFVSLQDISVSDRSGNGLILEMPTADNLRSALSALGISDTSRVVVCYGKDRLSSATRIVFTLDYAGLGDRAALLDGGLAAWVREGRPVTTAVPEPRSGALSPLKTSPIIVDGAWVLAHLGTRGVSIVDARAPAFFSGAETGGSKDHPHRTGHVAGARNVPFSEVTDEQAKLRSSDDLAALFDKAGVRPGDTVVGYCHVGQQATAMLFAARILGHPVLLYDGSFEDWSRHPDYPVENPSKKQP